MAGDHVEAVVVDTNIIFQRFCAARAGSRKRYFVVSIGSTSAKVSSSNSSSTKRRSSA